LKEIAMSSLRLDQSHSINPRYEECLRLSKSWVWFVSLGVVLMIVGAVALSSTVITTLASLLVFGVLLMAGGLVQIVNAFLGRSWRAFFLHLFAGILQLIVGELLIEHPLVAAEGLTLVLAVGFLLGGALRLVYGLVESFPGRGWVLLNGLIVFALGISIWRQWPASSLWVIGLFIGIDLIFSGWSWVMLGLLVKAPQPEPAPLDPKAASSTLAGTR
jgi:uncharacterized membrane protein HdeD (DUF308 family)